jgi:hypothetical protein
MRVQPHSRGGDAGRVRFRYARSRLLRQVEALARRVVVGRIEQGEIVRITGREITLQAGAKRITPWAKASAQHGAARGQAAEVDGVAAIGATDGDGDVGLCRVAGGSVP